MKKVSQKVSPLKTKSNQKYALLSVSEKKGITGFAKSLVKLGYRIIATKGTAKTLTDNKIPVTPIQNITGYSEPFSRRIKSTDFKIESGIVFDRSKPSHRKQVQKYGIPKIDIVVCNFYPFAQTRQKQDATLSETIENIDVGGPTMLKSAAKNYKHVLAVSDPADYQRVAKALNKGAVSTKLRRELAAKVFAKLSFYNTIIAHYLSSQNGERSELERLKLPLFNLDQLRYGENPHQEGWIWQEKTKDPLALYKFKQLQGKQLSLNNFSDIDNAVFVISSLGQKQPTCVVVKHTNPCGTAIDKNIKQAFIKAWNGDSLAAFGSIVVVNRRVDVGLAKLMLKNNRFFEVLVCPSISAEAKNTLSIKKNLRVLVNPALSRPRLGGGLDFKKIRGGLLLQKSDVYQLKNKNIKVVTKKKPSKKQLTDLIFAWKIAQVSKANAIVLVKNQQLISSGVGQQDRFRCCQLAINKADKLALNTVAASDAFFPFADGPETLIKAGIKAIIQPGGSIRDQETIDLCNKYKIPMVFTGIRCFKH